MLECLQKLTPHRALRFNGDAIMMSEEKVDLYRYAIF